MTSTDVLIARHKADREELKEEIWDVMGRYEYLQNRIIEISRYIKELEELKEAE